jgi:hypothetical protein
MSSQNADGCNGGTWIINLSSELQVRLKILIDSLRKIGIHEKKTYSSFLSLFEADQVRRYFRNPENFTPIESRAAYWHRVVSSRRRLVWSIIDVPLYSDVSHERR